MVTELQYTNIKRVLDDIMDHPLLRDVTLEQVIRYVLRFISLHGYSKLYQDKIEDVHIDEFRGLLPCDLISIIQVRDKDSKICLRAMTDNFTPGIIEKHEKHNPHHEHHEHHERELKDFYIPRFRAELDELSFKTQGRVIFTSFPHGVVELSYKAIPTDEDGYPLLIDNETYLNALEAYIKMKVFTIKFDTGKITANILQQAQQDYGIASKLLQREFTNPSISEMEAISRYLTTTIKSSKHFDKGFRNLGNREYIKKH